MEKIYSVDELIAHLAKTTGIDVIKAMETAAYARPADFGSAPDRYWPDAPRPSHGYDGDSYNSRFDDYQRFAD